MAIITISRQEGSFGNEIASRIAEKFKWPYFDKNIIEKALEDDYKLEAEKFDRYDEKKPKLLDSFMHDYDRYFNYLKLFLFNVAFTNEGCIILGRGGGFILKKIPGVFRVKLIASEATRINRISKKHECDVKHAQKIIHHIDHERNGFNRFFYGKSWNESSHYDLILNTDQLTDEAVSVIVTSAYNTFIKEIDDTNSKSLINELLLAQKIHNSLKYTEKIPVKLFEVDVTDHTALLTGIVEVESRIRQCEECAISVEGIEKVINNITFIQHKTW